MDAPTQWGVASKWFWLLRIETWIRVGVVTAALLLIKYHTAVAQDSEREQFWSGDSIVTSVAPLDELKSRCPRIRPNQCSYPFPVISDTCQVVGVDSLGAVAETNYHLARYLFKTTFQETEAEVLTCEADAVVLLESSNGWNAMPVWSGSTERTYEFIRGAAIAGHEDAALFSILYCLNGTGGCVDRLLMRRNRLWEPLERDESWERVYSQLPAGYRLHKSPAIDIRNLTWEQHLAVPNDANCCSSGRLFLDLDLVEGKLSVKKARLTADLFIE